MSAQRVATRSSTHRVTRRVRTAAGAQAPAAEAPSAPPADAGVSAFVPLPYQQRWIADTHRWKIGLWARQTGKSTAVALEINADILAAEAAGRKTHWVLLSRGERQSVELARKVRDFGRLISAARKILQGPELGELGGGASEIVYPGGSRAVALPANPDTARGYSGNVVLDEFAFHADSDAIWAALYPTITRWYKIRIISTPNGQQNRYYQLWTEAQQPGSAWHAHRCDLTQAVSEGLAIDPAALRAGLRDEEAWRQEYLCEFVDEATAWLTWELIRAAEDPRASLERRALSNDEAVGTHYAGWDVARWHDLSVVWVVERVGDVLWTREVLTMRRASFEEQLARVAGAMQYYGVRRLCLDATGMGEMPAEQAARRWSGRVEPIKFTGGIKEHLAGDLRRLLEDRKLRLPIAEDVRADLHSVRALRTAAGNVRFAGETRESHADRFWALALAVHGAVRPSGAGLWVPGGDAWRGGLN